MRIEKRSDWTAQAGYSESRVAKIWSSVLLTVPLLGPCSGEHTRARLDNGSRPSPGPQARFLAANPPRPC